jgi:hypothetical protein
VIGAPPTRITNVMVVCEVRLPQFDTRLIYPDLKKRWASVRLMKMTTI